MGRSRTIGADNEMAGPPGGPENAFYDIVFKGKTNLLSFGPSEAPVGGPPGGPPAVTETL